MEEGGKGREGVSEGGRVERVGGSEGGKEGEMEGRREREEGVREGGKEGVTVVKG